MESIDKLDIHFKTDEAFVLLSGKTVLIAAKIENENISYDIINMENTFYGYILILIAGFFPAYFLHHLTETRRGNGKIIGLSGIFQL